MKPAVLCSGSTTQEGREGLWVLDMDPSGVTATPGRWSADRYELEPHGDFALLGIGRDVSGIGLGARISFPIVRNGFIRTLNNSVAVTTGRGGLPIVRLTHACGATAEVYLYGGCVCSWTQPSGDEILYVGDHMFGDVHVSKSVLRWRTALILRELEDEIEAIAAFLLGGGRTHHRGALCWDAADRVLRLVAVLVAVGQQRSNLLGRRRTVVCWHGEVGRALEHGEL